MIHRCSRAFDRMSRKESVSWCSACWLWLFYTVGYGPCPTGQNLFFICLFCCFSVPSPLCMLCESYICMYVYRLLAERARFADFCCCFACVYFVCFFSCRWRVFRSRFFVRETPTKAAKADELLLTYLPADAGLCSPK